MNIAKLLGEQDLKSLHRIQNICWDKYNRALAIYDNMQFDTPFKVSRVLWDNIDE